jgi:hypothetical protein
VMVGIRLATASWGGSRGGVLKSLLELRPDFFDGVKIRRARWKIEHSCSGCLDPLAHAVYFMNA